MTDWLAWLCALTVLVTAAYLLLVILRPDKF